MDVNLETQTINGADNHNIDFVIMWVDGSDPNWLKEKMEYKIDSQVPDEQITESAKNFRDWDILQYWFRGVEEFAPWVRKVHFVTYGHLPKWLNVNCEKLNIVCHTDFMPADSLPTFNSRALELNLFRIAEMNHAILEKAEIKTLEEMTRDIMWQCYGAAGGT